MIDVFGVGAVSVVLFAAGSDVEVAAFLFPGVQGGEVGVQWVVVLQRGAGLVDGGGDDGALGGVMCVVGVVVDGVLCVVAVGWLMQPLLQVVLW